MRNKILIMVTLLSIVGICSAKSPQFPMTPQFPIVTEKETQLCQCSKNGGLCTCTPAHDDCGCYQNNLYHWIETNRTGHTALYKGNRQIGNYKEEEGLFYWLVEDDKDNYHWALGTCPVDTMPNKKAQAKPQTIVVPRTSPYVPQMLNYSSFGGGSGSFNGACKS